MHIPFTNKVLFWVCITADGLGPLAAIDCLMNATKYLDTFSTAALPFLQQRGLNRVTLQQDKARVVMQSLAENDVQVLPWPAFSPDMNPMKNMGSI